MPDLKSALVILPIIGASLSIAPPADAQPADAQPTDAQPADAQPAAPAAPSPEAGTSDGEVDDDGVRFRGGVSGGGGALIGGGLTFGLGGFDGRLGVQINDLIGVYVQPQLAIFGASSGIAGLPAIGGIVGGTAVVDFTFIDQIFAGVGGGGALLNNPAGGTLHIRAGGYPLMGFGEDGIRRKGLMLGADLRVYFVSGSTFVSPMASIGYEAF